MSGQDALSWVSMKASDDSNVVAHGVLSQVLANEEQRRAIMREMGRRGGLKGGKAAAASMTKAERVERARKAGSAPKRLRKP
jgi:hypothetical protein